MHVFTIEQENPASSGEGGVHTVPLGSPNRQFFGVDIESLPRFNITQEFVRIPDLLSDQCVRGET
jgi:hypothetical protein